MRISSTFMLFGALACPVLASPPILLNPLANDFRVDASSITMPFQPNYGTALLRADGRIEYTPDPGVTNTVDTVQYRVCGAADTTDCSTRSIQVHIGGPTTTYAALDVFDIPRWNGGAQPVYNFNLLANDLNVQSGSLRIIFLPIHGTISLSGDQLVYRPPFGYTGVDSALISVINGRGVEESFSVSIHLGQPTTHVAVSDLAWFPIFDTDADGLSDHWETSYATGLGTFTAGGDNDGDGITNHEECIAGSDPLDDQSFFRITDMVWDPDATCFRLTYTTGRERSFEFDRSTDLFFTNPQSSFSGFRGTGEPLTTQMPCPGTFGVYRLWTSFR